MAALATITGTVTSVLASVRTATVTFTLDDGGGTGLVNFKRDKPPVTTGDRVSVLIDRVERE